MIYKIKYKNLVATFGTWLPALSFRDLLKIAIIHNQMNIKYPVEDCLEEIFRNIVKEVDFFEETSSGHTIHNDNIDVIFEMMYHTDNGLMFEGVGKILTHPIRIYAGDEND